MSEDAMRPTDRGLIAAALVRDFIAKTLAHEAVADEVAELCDALGLADAELPK